MKKMKKLFAMLIAMVMLNIITPNSDITIRWSPNIRNGAASAALTSAVRLKPNRSASMPPSALPTPMNENSITVCTAVLFHEVGMP